jgi:hypothetical protein
MGVMFKSAEQYKQAISYYDQPLVYTQAFTNKLLGVGTFAKSYADQICKFFFY